MSVHIDYDSVIKKKNVVCTKLNIYVFISK
jgi:hypothetical protein